MCQKLAISEKNNLTKCPLQIISTNPTHLFSWARRKSCYPTRLGGGVDGVDLPLPSYALSVRLTYYLLAGDSTRNSNRRFNFIPVSYSLRLRSVRQWLRPPSYIESDFLNKFGFTCVCELLAVSLFMTLAAKRTFQGWRCFRDVTENWPWNTRLAICGDIPQCRYYIQFQKNGLLFLSPLLMGYLRIFLFVSLFLKKVFFIFIIFFLKSLLGRCCDWSMKNESCNHLVPLMIMLSVRKFEWNYL